MRTSLIFLATIVFSSCSVNYAYRLSERIDQTEFVLKWDSTQIAGNNRINAFAPDKSVLAELGISAFNEERSKHHRKNLQRDSLFDRITLTFLEDFKSSRFLSSDSWRKENNALRDVLQIKKSRYKVYTIYALSLDILDLDFTSSFYHDVNHGTSSLNLYKGKRPKKQEMESEPIPLETITEIEYQKRLVQLFSHGRNNLDMLSGQYEVASITAGINQSSLRGEKRPEILLVIMFGGKKLQSTKISKTMEEQMFNSKNQ